MKFINRLLYATALTILILVVFLHVSGNSHIVNALKRTYLVGEKTANINDYQQFETRTISADKNNQQPWVKHEKYNLKPLPSEFVEELNKYNTAAFLVIKDGQLISEHYFNDYTDRSKTNSFSMAKTVTAMLLGIAIEEGHISGLDQAVTDFLPELEHNPTASKVTIGNLAKMNSGFEWQEHYYSVLSPTVKLVYGDDVTDFLLKGHFSAEPGTVWEYSSASTQLMGIFIARALEKAGAAESLSDYLSQKVWQPLGMNDDAPWHLDNSGMELVFCCINTNARNFAKLGLLMLNGGQWQGQQIIPANYVNAMVSPLASDQYGLSTWLSYDNELPFYWFSGHLGQYIVNIPELNMVIVRLGETNTPTINYRVKGSIANYIRQVYLKHAIELSQ